MKNFLKIKFLKIFLENFQRMTHKFQNRPLGRCNWRWRYGATISSLTIYLLRFWGVFWYASWLTIYSSWTLIGIIIGHFCRLFDKAIDTFHLYMSLYLRQPVVFIILGGEIYVFEVKSVLMLNCKIVTDSKVLEIVVIEITQVFYTRLKLFNPQLKC